MSVTSAASEREKERERERERERDFHGTQRLRYLNLAIMGIYSVSKKSCPSLYSESLYKDGQYFLDT